MVGEVARGLSLFGGASSEVRRCNCSVVDESCSSLAGLDAACISYLSIYLSISQPTRITILCQRGAFSWAKRREAGGPPPPYHAAADLCESVWRRRMAPALSTTYMVGRVLRLYVKEERFIPVLEVLVRFLNDKITKTE
eukprot:scaffold93751_cov63-Phaeocystis_antarctica.AAC.1